MLRYTICTLVNDEYLYDKMVQSFVDGGFDGDVALYHPIRKASDAYSGLNSAIASAKTQYVILCHQDVALLDDGVDRLDCRLSELTVMDPAWGVAGNAGANVDMCVCRISDLSSGDNQGEGLGYPIRIETLDENFLIVRQDSRISFSHDIIAWHLYGADLCLHAEILGFSSYVIDFHLWHGDHRRGRRTLCEYTDFNEASERFMTKWWPYLKGRELRTTCVLMRFRS